MTPELILASSSPRRRELMGLTGISFTIDAPEIDETCNLPAKEAVQDISRRKALAAAEKHPGAVILAADTLVAIDNHPLGKPKDKEDAIRMLSSLRNRWHKVYTGVTVISPEGNCETCLNENDVRFGNITDGEIRRYIATGEPMDKAGAYAIQGIAGIWIEEAKGSISGIIGLPMSDVRRMLQRCGIEMLPMN